MTEVGEKTREGRDQSFEREERKGENDATHILLLEPMDLLHRLLQLLLRLGLPLLVRIDCFLWWGSDRVQNGEDVLIDGLRE